MKIKESSLKNLKPNKSHWNNSDTCTIRVPRKLKKSILEYAKELDSGNCTNETRISTVTVELLKNILLKIEAKEKGYKSNSASQLIKDLKRVINYG